MIQKDSTDTHPKEVLRQVADSISQDRDKLTVTLPTQTTWKEAIHAVEESLGYLDKPITISKASAETRRRHLRQMTFEQRRELDSKPVGLPIRSTVDLKSLPLPPRPSESVRNRLT